MTMTDAPETLWVDPASEDDLNMYVGHSSDTMDYLNMDVEYTRTDYLVAAQARIAELEAVLNLWHGYMHNEKPDLNERLEFIAYLETCTVLNVKA
jgi:hypothetical protein